MKKYEKFGRVMRAHRILKGMKVPEVCEFLGIKEQRYYKFESGTSVPNLALAVKISDFLEFDLAESVRESLL